MHWQIPPKYWISPDFTHNVNLFNDEWIILFQLCVLYLALVKKINKTNKQTQSTYTVNCPQQFKKNNQQKDFDLFISSVRVNTFIYGYYISFLVQKNVLYWHHSIIQDLSFTSRRWVGVVSSSVLICFLGDALGTEIKLCNTPLRQRACASPSHSHVNTLRHWASSRQQRSGESVCK